MMRTMIKRKWLLWVFIILQPKTKWTASASHTPNRFYIYVNAHTVSFLYIKSQHLNSRTIWAFLHNLLMETFALACVVGRQCEMNGSKWKFCMHGNKMIDESVIYSSEKSSFIFSGPFVSTCPIFMVCITIRHTMYVYSDFYTFFHLEVHI